MRRMHDPKFEKEVQQKLQELSFSPSEAVWTNIERAVGGEKKRRVPVFWIFLLSALTMTGTGLVYFSTRTGMAHREIANHAAASPAPAAGTVATERTTTTAEKSTITADRITTAGKTTAIADKAATPSPRDIHTKNTPVPAVTMAQDAGGIPPVEGRSRQQAEVAANGRTAQQADVTPAAAEKANLPALNVFDHRFIVSAAPRLSSRSQAATAANAPIQLTPKYSWEAGFAGGIGVSALNRTLFQEPSAVAVASDVRQNANSSTAVTGAPRSYTSKIRPDLSYWAGIVVQRPLDKRLTLSLGLDLHYYSTKVQIGEKVTTPPSYLSQSLLYSQAPQTQAARYPYYPVGDKITYTNRYYFIELPASVLWQVNHSRHLPLFWENGFSLAYLVSSNAVYYDQKSTVFYKDGGMTNKVQLNLATALLVGLPIKGIRLQAGPQIQYGITSLQGSGGAGGQHLFYGGFRLVLLPGKAKK